MEDSPCVAALDIGTNSVKLLVGSVGTGGVVTTHLHRVRITRMGAGLWATGLLDELGIARTIVEMHELLALARDWKPVRVMAVGLEAFRQAENGVEMVARISRETGIPVRVLSGDDEARLSREAVLRAWGDVPGSRLLTIDIGGASTELALGTPPWETSMPLGVVTLSDRFMPSGEGGLGAMAGEVERCVREAWARRSVGEGPLRGVVVGGTGATFASIEQGLDGDDPSRVNGHPVLRSSVQAMRDRLVAMALEERRRVRGLHPLRAPVIVAGLVLLETIMGVCGLESATVSIVDLLHAVLARVGRAEEGWI